MAKISPEKKKLIIGFCKQNEDVPWAELAACLALPEADVRGVYIDYLTNNSENNENIQTDR